MFSQPLSIVFSCDYMLFKSTTLERWARGSKTEAPRDAQAITEAPPDAPPVAQLQQPDIGPMDQPPAPPPLRRGSIPYWAARKERRAARAHSQAIDRAISQEAKRKRGAQCNLILFGSDLEGIKDLVETVNTWSSDNYTPEERAGYRLSVYKSLVDAGRTLVGKMERIEVVVKNEEVEGYCSFLKAFVLDPDPQKPLDPQVGEAISALWKFACSKRVLERLEQPRDLEWASHYLTEAPRISAPDYLPTEDDINRQSRIGLFSETRWSSDRGLALRFIDMGRSYWVRKRIFPFFDYLPCILFIVDLATYDEPLYESDEPWVDPENNRLKEAMHLFSSVANSSCFLQSSIMLFLNNIRGFKEKLPCSPLQNHFPDYVPDFVAGSDYSSACQYFFDRFETVGRAGGRTGAIYTHFTQTDDRVMMRCVLDAVVDIIICENLRMLRI